MPHSKQARKRLRQSEVRRVYNKSLRSRIRTLTKAFDGHIEENETEEAGTVLRQLVSQIDKATKVNVYHRNSAARKKAHAARQLNSLAAK
jgi:small subunit ribosomal protein S20